MAFNWAQSGLLSSVGAIRTHIHRLEVCEANMYGAHRQSGLTHVTTLWEDSAGPGWAPLALDGPHWLPFSSTDNH